MNSLNLTEGEIFDKEHFDKSYMVYYGERNDIPYTMSKVNNQICKLQFPCENLDKELIKSIQKEWKTLMKEKKIKDRVTLRSLDQNSKGLTAILGGNKRTLTGENITFAIDFINKKLSENKVEFLDSCRKCKEKTDQLAYYKGIVSPLCDSCANEIEDKKDKKDKPLQYITGLIGALIGAFIGPMIYLFFAYRFGLLIFPITLAFSFISLKFYELFKGPKKILYANLIIDALTIISSIIVSYFYLVDFVDQFLTLAGGVIGIIFVYPVSLRYLSENNIYIFNKDN